MCIDSYADILIHAPTRGATHNRGDRSCRYSISIHAPTRGATPLSSRLLLFLPPFQSTLPREERPQGKVYYDDVYGISIHAPTRGATHRRSAKQSAHLYFNPRSHERSDTCLACMQTKTGDFNPRSHERSDRQDRLVFSVRLISIHAPTRGATVAVSTISFIIGISIHAPMREATAILHKKFVYFYTIPTINI